jgi:hypothetical protein
MHRFQCSSEQMTCLPMMYLAENHKIEGMCINKYDRIMKGNGRYLNSIKCDLLRYYIDNLSISNSTFTDNVQGLSTVY